MCKRLLFNSIRQQQKDSVRCPVKLSPSCHPKAAVDVHIDGLGGIIYLSCSKCDRLIEKIKVPKYTLPKL